MSAIQQMLAAGKSVPPDTNPDPFSFIDQSGVAPSTIIYSNTVTITGINTLTNVSVSGGGQAGVSINGGGYGAGGTISNNQTLRLRQTTTSLYGQPHQAVLVVGDATAFWTVTTRVADETPNAFDFGSVSGATPGQPYESGTIYISGLEPNYTVLISAQGYGTIDANASPVLTGAFEPYKYVVTDSTGGFFAKARAFAPGTAGSSYTYQAGCGGQLGYFTIYT